MAINRRLLPAGDGCGAAKGQRTQDIARILLTLLAVFAISSQVVRAEEQESIAKLEAAAARGDATAEFELGRAYDIGKEVPTDSKRAFEYYRRAAEHGNAKAQNNLAALYATGTDAVPKDEKEARKWLRKAAEQGPALAQANLGAMLLRENDKEGLTWLEKAAAQGLVSAQVRLGEIYYNGDAGVPKDYVKAFDWLRKAADQGNAWAQNMVGVMFQNGQGGPKDLNQAVFWFSKAAEQGDAKAQSNLGQMLCAGNGVQRDVVEGYKWLLLAREQHEITAEKFLGGALGDDGFENALSPAERAAAEKLAEEYKQRHNLSVIAAEP